MCYAAYSQPIYGFAAHSWPFAIYEPTFNALLFFFVAAVPQKQVAKCHWMQIKPVFSLDVLVIQAIK